MADMLWNLEQHAPRSPKDPFLVVNPSFDDSLLLREGLVEHTQRPRPTLKAYDVLSSFTLRLQIDRMTDGTLTPGRGQEFGLGLGEGLAQQAQDSPPSPSRKCVWRSRVEGRLMGRVIKTEEGGEGRVAHPPPAYSRYSIGQRKGRTSPYDSVCTREVDRYRVLYNVAA